MSLSECFSSKTNNEFLSFIKTNLDQVQVRISYTGTREVCIKEYAGSVELNEFAKKIFSSDLFDFTIYQAPPQEAKDIFCKIHQLYDTSERLVNSLHLYYYIVRFREFTLLDLVWKYSPIEVSASKVDRSSQINQLQLSYDQHIKTLNSLDSWEKIE